MHRPSIEVERDPALTKTILSGDRYGPCHWVFGLGDRIGISVRATSIHAAYVRAGRVIWRDSAPFGDAAGIRAAATHLLKSAPRGLRRPRVVALFGPRWVQLKRVLGLPAATPARVATDVIREHCPAFFLHKSALLIAEARRASDDAVWCAAFESSAVNAVIGALTAHRLRLRAAVPTVAALARERTGAWNFADGPDVLAVVSENGQLVSVSRALAPVENSTHDYEDTRAAARAWRARSLEWRPPQR